MSPRYGVKWLINDPQNTVGYMTTFSNLIYYDCVWPLLLSRLARKFQDNSYLINIAGLFTLDLVMALLISFGF